MRITFLIGNGFDRNLGLKTAYSEFIKEYKKKTAHTENLKRFRKHVDENEELWSSAEVALGLLTNQFNVGKAVEFSECHADICKELAKYLKEQQQRIDYDSNADKIKKAFKNMNNISRSFPTQEKDTIDNVFSIYRDENTVFQFICFNYTETLNKCIGLIENEASVLGNHNKNNGQLLRHCIGQTCYVHGTVEKEMVFGVNDDEQIANPKVFECDNGDIYKNFLIKRSTNLSYQENTDSRAQKIIQDSHIIYIYGMSIGVTDKIWWERICKWLEGNNNRHLIVQKYSMPEKGVFPIEYLIAERDYKRLITQYSSYDGNKRQTLERQIHITADNIFMDIRDIALD